MDHPLILSVVLAAVELLVPGAAAFYPPLQVCNETDNFAAKSRYLSNIKFIGGTLPMNASTSPDLFATTKVGSSPDQVWALALCRGDTNASYCLSCLTTAFADLPNECAYNKDAAIYYDTCMLHYSDTDFLTADDDSWRTVNTTVGDSVTSYTSDSPDRFNRVVAELVNATADCAAYNTARRRRYAAGEADFNQEIPKIYSMAQCTPDLTPARCRSCLSRIIFYLPELFANYTGGMVLGVRCSFRYDTNSFFLDDLVMVRLGAAPSPSSGRALPPSPAPSMTSVATDDGGERTRSKRKKTISIVVPVVAAILTTMVACFCTLRRIKRTAAKPPQSYPIGPDDIRSIDSLLLDLQALHVATDGFAEDRKLGEGGFGVVYKGILHEGQEVAVKRLSQSSKQGIEELKTELLLIATLNHINLVRLVGVCLEKYEKILVYEYMPNRSLDTILFDTEKNKELDWGKRFKIINGIARGLQYLHEDSQMKIVHRDLKASNVLLDASYNPKISDFGLAKIFGGDQSHIVTYRIAGTYGYMSPEYAMRGQYSMKSDVFSFGVLVLEIVTGRRNCGSYDSEQNVDLINDTWEHWIREKPIELIDPSLSNHCPVEHLLKCIHIGLLCVQQKPADRPLMSAVNFMLSSKSGRLPPLSRPAFCTRDIGANSTKVSLNEPSITEVEPR